MRGIVLLLAAGLSLSACGLSPVYTGGHLGTADRMLATIEVPEIPDKTGFLVRERLLERLHHDGAAAPSYRLDVVLDDAIEGFGVRGDNSIVRERRTLRARFRLVDRNSGDTLLDRTTSADAGIDVVQSEYAVVSAEESARTRLARMIADQIVAQIALYGKKTGTTAP